ncbi:MAG: hypothetical protein AAF921_27980 [Cyanobacteria bacterium P01_D01_bin.44]
MFAFAFHAILRMGCTLGIFSILGLCVWRCLTVLKQGTNYIRQLHSIPCSQCAYFTGDYRLKCTVNPVTALTEAAIGCADYESTLKQPCLGGCGYPVWKSSSCHHATDLVKR